MPDRKNAETTYLYAATASHANSDCVQDGIDGVLQVASIDIQVLRGNTTHELRFYHNVVPKLRIIHGVVSLLRN